MIDQNLLRERRLSEYWWCEQFDHGGKTGVGVALIQESGRAFARHAINVRNLGREIPDVVAGADAVEYLADWANRILRK